jgi:AraC-like DNA-binding protein
METLRITGCAIASLFAVGNLLIKGRTAINVLSAFLLADIACIIGLSSRSLSSPLAVCGILMYFLFSSLTRSNGDKRNGHMIIFLLLIPSAFSDIFFYGFKRNHLSELTALLASGLRIFVGVAVLVLCIVAIIHVFRLYSSKTMIASAWVILILSVSCTFSLLIGSAGMVLSDGRITAVADGFVSVIVIIVALLHFRYPEALREFKDETVRRGYARSKLIGLDTDGLAKGMIMAVSKEALFRDEKFSLEGLALRMGLSPHQVSELLNDRMRISFRDFINGFRVDKAKEILTTRPDMKVLAVALEVGFGNKTSFNEAFKRREGKTPSDYRAETR